MAIFNSKLLAYLEGNPKSSNVFFWGWDHQQTMAHGLVHGKELGNIAEIWWNMLEFSYPRLQTHPFWVWWIAISRSWLLDPRCTELTRLHATEGVYQGSSRQKWLLQQCIRYLIYIYIYITYLYIIILYNGFSMFFQQTRNKLAHQATSQKRRPMLNPASNT